MTTRNASDWAQSRETGARWQFRLMCWLGLNAPVGINAPLIWVISLVYALQGRRPTTRASVIYLERLLGRKPGLRERHRHTRTFSHVFLDRVRLLSNDLDGFHVDVDGQHLIEEVLKQGRGGVLLGAHFGSFEMLRSYDRGLPDLRVRYLMYAGHAPGSSEVLNELNSSVAERIISLQDSRQAMLQVYEALDCGEFVAFLGDRVPDRSVRGQVTVPFLGEPIRLPTSPYVAALAARVPLFMCVAPRLGNNHYAIEFSMLYDGSPVARSERGERIKEMARRYVETLEGLCRRHPYNWFNFYDIWRE